MGRLIRGRIDFNLAVAGAGQLRVGNEVINAGHLRSTSSQKDLTEKTADILKTFKISLQHLGEPTGDLGMKSDRPLSSKVIK